ncbi:MAG: hypothetical protein MI745_00330 [Pseudomonadales bacterium]|nr:hypothetical protein [Pseudomonadales bacterium]
MFYRIDFCDEEAAYLLLSGYSPQDFDGHKLESGWKGARCELVEGELNDFLHCELGAPACNERVENAIEKYIGEEIEFLPIETWGGDRFYLMNPLVVCDCLSLKSSLFDALPSGKIFSIDKHVLLLDSISANFVFKIKQTAHVEIFCTEKFRELIEGDGLSGVDFIPVEVE